MTAHRERLGNRRPHEVFDFVHEGHIYTVGVGRYPDGRLAELFMDCGKSGTLIQTHAKDNAVVLSLLLQHGVSIDQARHAVVRNPDGSAAGPVGALLDYLAGDAEHLAALARLQSTADRRCAEGGPTAELGIRAIAESLGATYEDVAADFARAGRSSVLGAFAASCPGADANDEIEPSVGDLGPDIRRRFHFVEPVDPTKWQCASCDFLGVEDNLNPGRDGGWDCPKCGHQMWQVMPNAGSVLADPLDKVAPQPEAAS